MKLKTKWIDFLYKVATGNKKARNVFTPIGATFYGVFKEGHPCSFLVLGLNLKRKDNNPYNM